MRVLAVDLGRKRIGLAVANTETRLPSPCRSLVASGSLARDAEAISRLAAEEAAALVVVGLPLNEQDPSMARICEKLADKLLDLGLQVRLVDESLTSVEAELQMSVAGLKASERNRKRDGEAACRILDRYFHENS